MKPITVMATSKTILPPRRTQRAIVEPGFKNRLLVMMDDGSVHHARTALAALKIIKAYAATANPGLTVTVIEWRDGIKPPEVTV